MTTQCEICGKQIDESIAHYDEEGTPHCPDCAEEMSLPCECCGIVKPMWLMSSTDRDEIYCEACASIIY